MSAAISHRPEGFAADRLASRQWRSARNLPYRFRRASPGAVASIAFLALLTWGFVGSLTMGLRTPATAEPRMAVFWLAGAILIVATGLATGLLAGTRPGE